MNQYLIAFCYLFTVILLFIAFFICRAVPVGQPINIDLYRNNTIISFAISNPSQITYTVPEEQHKAINNNWAQTIGTNKKPNSNSIPLSGLTGCSTMWISTKSERSQDISLPRTSKTSWRSKQIPFPCRNPASKYSRTRRVNCWRTTTRSVGDKH